MLAVLPVFMLLPLLALAINLFVPRKKERVLSGVAIAATSLQLALAAGFTAWWAAAGAPVLDHKYLVLFRTPEFEFFIDLLFDRTTAVFALAGALTAFFVSIFSRYYMHREAGFKRYFCTLLLFISAYNTLVFSGNFETLFVGWEILGVTSFLLIAYYRDRYLPVKNAFKVLSYYRLGDICLILAMWMSHHLWHKNITFLEWTDSAGVAGVFEQHYAAALFIAIMVVVAALIKSAQFPFSAWLPRAMEGPTSSSAIFYGSLAVHIGVFLLLRTWPFWEHDYLVRGLVILTGAATALTATFIARVQSTVKTQIAYASIAQIGLMFIEIGLGWHWLALAHFVTNAFLRAYQLLVSPSVLSYLTHDMLFHFKPQPAGGSSEASTRMRRALYVWSVKEFNLDYWLKRIFWQPFKWVGRQLGDIDRRQELLLWSAFVVVGIVLFLMKTQVGGRVYEALPLFYSGLSFLTVLKGFSERGDARHAWLLIFSSQIFTALSILFNKHFEPFQVVMYLGGSGIAAAVGYYCLHRLNRAEPGVELMQYHGHSYKHNNMALLFLVAGLGMAGFPITPSFIGIDLMFTHVYDHQIALITVMALNFLFLELAILRIYNRIFMGQHRELNHPIAFRSS